MLLTTKPQRRFSICVICACSRPAWDGCPRAVPRAGTHFLRSILSNLASPFIQSAGIKNPVHIYIQQTPVSPRWRGRCSDIWVLVLFLWALQEGAHRDKRCLNTEWAPKLSVQVMLLLYTPGTTATPSRKRICLHGSPDPAALGIKLALLLWMKC